jgi:hypothetical protein
MVAKDAGELTLAYGLDALGGAGAVPDDIAQAKDDVTALIVELVEDCTEGRVIAVDLAE